MSPRKSLRNKLGLMASVMVTASLGGCIDYAERNDTLTFRAGDAKAWNKTVHTSDPWPPYVMNNNIPGDGQRTARVIQKYSTGGGAATSAAAPSPADNGSTEASGGTRQ